MKTRSIFLSILLLTIAVLVLGGCTPKGPTYIQALYYRDVSTDTQSGYDFIQFYENGFFTYCNVEPDTITSLEVTYTDICEKFLVLTPGATGVPGEAGNYVIVGDLLTLNYPSVDEYQRLTGSYSPEELVITGSDGSTWTYQLYP